MKNAAILMVILLITSCVSKNTISDKPCKIIIAGKVETNKPDQKAELMMWFDGLSLREVTKTKWVELLGDKGEFRFESELYYPTDMRVRAGDVLFSIILHPNDSIFINVDEANGSVKFSGDRKETNEYINKYEFAIRNKTNEHWDLAYNVLKLKDAKVYKAFIDSIYQVEYNIAKQFVDTEKPNEEASRWIILQSRENYQELLFDYGITYGADASPDYFYKALEEILLITKETLLNGYLVDRMQSIYTFFYVQPAVEKEMKDGQDSIVLKKIIELVPDKYLQQMIIANMITRDYFNKGKLSIYENNRDFFDSYFTLPSLPMLLNQRYEKVKYELSLTSENMTAYRLKKLEGTSAKAIIDEVFEKNNGSVIYIDYWATWCGPCLAAMRKSKPYMKELDGKVAFVFLCMDSEEDEWQQAIQKNEIKGQHYFLDAAQSKAAKEAFEIVGIPFYMLLDKSGAIVESGSDLRIYNENVYAKIVELVEK
ncbi:MAG: TlpA family protein disulfide reductase [Prevotellaceae bacterium]|jgi:thiol-disulfide isomerase/thioredoxin|nr:TlpA family protein disulfide reductase [Prevotellaceae bacterium]